MAPKAAAAKEEAAAAQPEGGGAAAAARPADKKVPLYIRFLCLAGIIGIRYLSSVVPGFAPKQEASTEDVDGSCPAGGCGAPEEAFAAEPVVPRKWVSSASLTDQFVVPVNTRNFNETVTDTWQRPLLVAFYDPRSQSFKELRRELDETSATLHKAELEGNSLGRLGACDVTVNSFLGSVEAPEMAAAWQEAKADAFKFGRPRFFPLILILYWQGERVREYTGVVKAADILHFLRRLRSPKGGRDLANAAEVDEFLDGAGPFALGCGLEADWRAAFDVSAEKMHGTMTFGRAEPATCSKAFPSLKDDWPQVIWARDAGYHRALDDVVVMGNESTLMKWLGSHQAKLLEEMTPDNSHTYLDNPVPLVIYLADADDKPSLERGEQVFGEIDQELERRRIGKEREFQFVWSDCSVFAKQFDSQGQCPSVILVNPLRMNWARQPMSAVSRAALAGRTTESERLLMWLRNTSSPWRLELNRYKGEREAARKAREEQQERDAELEEYLEDNTGALPQAPLEKEDREYLHEIPDLSKKHNLTLGELVRGYHGLLEFMAQARQSFKHRYGKSLDFDWEPMDFAQSLHPHMKLLAQSPSAARKIITNPQRLQMLWKAIESRAAFSKSIESNKLKQQGEVAAAFMEGWNLLRKLFRRLYEFLHRQQDMDALGVPEREPKEVERRDAASLSVREFLDEFAIPGRPVIITGLNLTEQQDWTLDFFKRTCKTKVDLVQRNKLRGSWGRLEKGGSMTLSNFIDTFKTEHRKLYLHDWSLPRNCPAAFGPAPYRGFTVPKYFSGDYFQRSAFDGYQHTWPSLFIGSSETQSDMHIDSGGTNFWMYLLSGQKEWRFYSRKDIVNLYKNPLKATFEYDVFEPDLAKFPLAKYAQQYRGVQNPGELIFLPGGNPHGVRNLQDIHAVSMNYVDLSNVWIYLWHQLSDENMATQQWMSVEMFTDNVSFPHGLRSDQEPLRFGEWKSQRWTDMTYDIV